jgi:hypothetical protein
VGVGCELRLLREADAAVHRRGLQRTRVRDRVELLGDLHDELARGGEDQRRRARRLRGDALDQRQREGERLSRPGRRAHEHVVAGENLAYHQALDRERFGDAAARERVDDGARHAELGEGRLGHG